MYSEKVHIMNHPLVAHKLTIMRDKNEPRLKVFFRFGTKV